MLFLCSKMTLKCPNTSCVHCIVHINIYINTSNKHLPESDDWESLPVESKDALK